MSEETKKISFGFSKLSKKTLIVPSQNVQKTKPVSSEIEFIEGFERNSIKLKDPIKPTEKVLVIPLKRPSLAVTTIVNPPTEKVSPSDEGTSLYESQKACMAPNDLQSSVVEGKNLEKLTLDELAAKEILDDLNSEKTAKSETKVISVPISSSSSIQEKESTLDDYENVPVGEFGLAMLRGMGWAPGKGIGKNEKLVTPSSVPKVRPKGMGLGADKVIQIPSNDKSNTDDDLKMSIGSFIRVIAGPNKDCYGQIEGFDDGSGRASIKLAMKNQTVSLNEFMFQLVNKTEFSKNSKVVNVGKYEQYKEAEERGGPFKDLKSKSESGSISSTDNKDHRSNTHSSRSHSSVRTYDSKHSSINDKKTKKSVTKSHRDTSGSSDKSTSSSSSGYSKTKQRRKKKKPSSHRLKSRSRSRSPRRRKHKKNRS